MISFYDHTCDLAHVISRISLSTLACIDNSVRTNCDFINSHTCDLARVTSKIFLEHFGLHFQGHTLDNSVHTNCDLRCDLACVTLSLNVIASYNTNFAYTHDAYKLDFLDSILCNWTKPQTTEH